ncbi:MAG: hypothetical protein E7161_04615 [Firmicutes bacterium]|nr:hypothetical protein [Bacillota bacterium]
MEKKNSQTKLRLDVFYKSVEKQYVFLRRLALTFRARLPLLSELFQISENELNTLLEIHNPNYSRALRYLFYFDISDQEKAKSELLAYYQELLNAMVSKDKNRQSQLTGKIADSDLAEVFEKSQSGKRLSQDEYARVLNYQLKYAIALRNICYMLGVDKNTYKRNIKPILESDVDLKASYERLAEYNLMALDSYNKYIKHGCR